MEIRPAQVEDTPSMGRVMVDTFLASNIGILSEEALHKRKVEWTPEVSASNWARTIRELAQEPETRECIYVAVDESGEVLGLSMGGPSSDEADPETVGEVYALYVSEQHQGQGIGRALVHATAAHLAQLGMTTIHIATQAANANSRAFYERIGGRLVGTRDDYGDGELLPLVVYEYEWEQLQAR